MQVAINPTVKRNLITVTNPKGRIAWFAGIAEISRNTITKLRKEAELFAEETVVEKVEKALSRKDVRQLIKDLKKSAA